MLQYLLTGLAGIAVGVVGMRIWMSGNTQQAGGDAPSADEVAAASDRPGVSTRAILIGAGVLVVAAIALFVFRSPDDGTAPGATPMAATAGADQNLDDVDTMIERLAKRLEANPEDGEGFRMLGWSYVMTGKPKEAVAPYKRALELLPGQANVHTGYGEALVGIAGGKVTPEARKSFEKAVSLDPTEPRAHYFLALWKAQNGQGEAALDDWITLANKGPADAPWQAEVRSRIAEQSRKLGVDVSSRLRNAAAPAAASEPPVLEASTVAAANRLPEAERQSMIDGMVEGLAAKLKSNPRDVDGWIQLMRSRMVLKQTDQAGKDLASAREALSGDASGLASIDAAARQLGVPGAK